MIALILALEPTAPADGQAPGGMNSSLFMMLGLGVVFFFLLIRPAQKREKDRKALLKQVKKHDKVVTTGGMHGTVAAVDEAGETVTLDVGGNVRLRFSRSAIHTIVQPEAKKSDDAKQKKAVAKS